MKLETLAQAMARLDKEMSDCQTVKTFSSMITNTVMFDIVSGAVDAIAKDKNLFIGEKRWIKIPQGYELRVGFAPSDKKWFDVYGQGGKVRGSAWK